MADHSKPTTTSLYSAFVTELDARCDDLALQLDPALTTATNMITGSIRWTSASNKWQKWNGTTWADLSTGYAIPINGASVAATTLSASSTVSGTGFSNYLASPPAIGGTAAAAVTGTTVTATTQFSGPGTGLTGTAASLSVGGTAANSTNAATTDDTTTATPVYPAFVSATSGNNPIKVSSTKMTFVPSTGILSCTGFSGALNGTIGATTPSSGSFTTLSASSTVSGTGFSTYLASPPAIGGTAAAAGNFTALAASSTLATGGVAVAGYSFTSRSTGLANAYFVDTDAGAGGMNINFFKNSASPAASDDIALLRFYGNDSTAVQTEYVRLAATIADPTNASEDGTLSLFTIKAGTVAERVRYTSADGLYILDGAFRCPDAYASTTGTAANMVMSSASGILQRSTSSLRYKNSVADATYGLAEVMQLRPVTYKGNNDGDTVFGGFIAEEVHSIGLTQFVQYDAENRPDALAYGNMVSLLTKAIQEQQVVIEDLKARIAALEAK